MGYHHMNNGIVVWSCNIVTSVESFGYAIGMGLS